MAEVFDFGLQQHKIKMDGKFFENNLFAVAGDTGRRLEVQLLDSDNMVQNTTGISLRLNANVAGQATYAEATLVDATKGLYKLDLPNGMLIAPGNWQFQWQIIGANGEKLHSFAFMGTIGSNLAEGAAEGLNFYLNLEVLKQMQEDFISGAFDSEVLETNIAEKLNNLETQYAPKLTEVTAQLAQTIYFVTPEMFGAVGDGLVDDTVAIQTAFDSLFNVEFDSTKTYLITQPTYVPTDSKAIINLNNAKIKFNFDMNKPHSTEKSGIVNNVGMINVLGSLTGDLFQIDLTKPIDLSVGKLNLNVDASSFLNAGDFIRVDLRTGTPTSDYLGYRASFIAKITSVSAKVISIDYSVDKKTWSTVSIPMAEFSVATIQKVNVVKDVVIKNFNAEDYTALNNSWVSTTNTQYPSADSHYACTGITVGYVHNVTVENTKMDKGLYNSVYVLYAHESAFFNIENLNPRLFGGGEGYAIQLNHSTKCKIDTVKSTRARHTIDFSGSNNLDVSNIFPTNSRSDDVQFHGIFEHDITIKNIKGVRDDANTNYKPIVNLGSGLANFGNANANINFEDCDIFYNNSKDVNFSKNVHFLKCDVLLISDPYDVTFDKSKVELRVYTPTASARRGTTFASRFLLFNSNLYLAMQSGGTTYTIGRYDEFTYKGGNIKTTGNTDPTVGYLALRDIPKMTIDDVDYQLCIRVYVDIIPKAILKLINSTIVKTELGAVNFKSITSGSLKAIVSNNVFNRHPSAEKPSVSFGSTAEIINKLDLTLTGNIDSTNISYNSTLEANSNIKAVIKNNINIVDSL